MTVVIILRYRVVNTGGQGHDMVTPGQCRLSSTSLIHPPDFLCGLKIDARSSINHFIIYPRSAFHRTGAVFSSLLFYFYHFLPTRSNKDFFIGKKSENKDWTFSLWSLLYLMSCGQQHFYFVNHRKNICWLRTIISISSANTPRNYRGTWQFLAMYIFSFDFLITCGQSLTAPNPESSAT